MQITTAWRRTLALGPPVIAINNSKGGTGKSTLTINLADAWARGGLRVLVLDLDTNGDVLDGLTGQDDPDAGARLISAVVNNEPLQVIHGVRERLDVVPSSNELAGFSELHEILGCEAVPSRAELVSSFGTRVAAIVENYDVVIIDTAPGIPVLQQLAFAVSGYVTFALGDGTRATIRALRSAVRTVAEAKSVNPEIVLLGAVLARIPTQSTAVLRHIRQTLESYENVFSLFETNIPEGFAAAHTVQEISRTFAELSDISREYSKSGARLKNLKLARQGQDTKQLLRVGNAEIVAAAYSTLADEILDRVVDIASKGTE